MQHKVIGILSLLFASFLFAVPASAVDLPQCTIPTDFVTTGVSPIHFTLVAKDNFIFEGGNPASSIINGGNVLVTFRGPAVNPGTPNGIGFVKLGPNVEINGTVVADTIIFSDNFTAHASECIARVITGKPRIPTPTSCLPTTTPSLNFETFALAHTDCIGAASTVFSAGFCGPTPVVASCATTAAPLTVANGTTLTLPNAQFPDGSCIGSLTLKKGAVLNLSGTYTFKDARMQSGSQLNGPATVNVNGLFITESGALITDIDLNLASSQGDCVQIFNNSILTRVVVNAPFCRCHPHTGTQLLACSEMCCKAGDIEPITAVCEGPTPEFCKCEQGFKFQNNWQAPPPNNVGPIVGDLQDSRNCVPCAKGDSPATGFPTCP